jgi:hypothetical protein
VEIGEITALTLRNFVKALKLFCEMYDIVIPWRDTKPFYILDNNEKSDNIAPENSNPQPTNASSASHASSDINSEYPPKCCRCEYQPSNKQGYDSHCQHEHANLPAYPNKPSIDAYDLKSQGMSWEK